MPRIPVNDPLAAMNGAFKSGRILKSDFETFSRVYDPDKGNTTEAMDALREQAGRQKFLAAKNAERFDELSAKMDNKDSGSTFMANLVSPAFRANSSEVNIDMRKQSLSNYFKRNSAEMDEALSTRLTKMLGFDKEAQEKFVYAVLTPGDKAVDPKFRKMADSATRMMNEAFDMFNKEGGNMKKIQGAYLPQTHDTIKMQSAPKHFKPSSQNKQSRIIEEAAAARDEWVNLTMKHADFDKMDMAHLGDKARREALQEVYETITSNGMNKTKKAINERKAHLKQYEDLLKKGETKNAQVFKDRFKIKDGETVADMYKDFSVEPMTANARQAHREVHFKGANGWRAYQKAYGHNDVFKSITDYIDGMSMDIAAMQVLGPNPQRTWEKLKSKAAIEGKETGSKGHLQGMFDVATGKTDSTAATTTGEQALASSAGTFRSLGVAADLGGAVISSFTDIVGSAVTAGHMGMSPISTTFKALGTVGRRMFSGMKVSEKEIFAQRIGLVMDSFMSSIRNNRFSEGGGSPLIQKFADGTLRASGLMAWTNALRTSFAMEMSGLLADNIGKTLDSFTFGKQMRDTYGVSESDWAKLTKDDLTSFEKGSYLDTTKIFMKDSELSLKLSDIMNQETSYAVIMPDSRVRSITTGGGQQKGTVKGEAARTALMYKSFPISMMSVHFGRILGMESVGGKVAYGGSMVLGGAVMGMGVIQLKELLRGKDTIKAGDTPLDWAKLFGKGMMQAGGLGVIGDLLFSDATRYGGGMVSSFVGKAAQPLEDFDNVIKKPLQRGKPEDIPGAFVKAASRYVPGRNLWYTRLVYERYIADEIQKLVDPDYDRKLRKNMRKMRKETGQGYWLAPTKGLSEARKPELNPFRD